MIPVDVELGLGLSVATIVVVAGIVLVSWWLASYFRTRDAGTATGNVVGALGTFAVGSVTAITVALGEGAETLGMIGDVLAGSGPYLAHLVSVGLGWLALEGAIAITPRTWVIAMLGVLVLLVMFDRGRR